jgi:hypothetical protein
LSEQCGYYLSRISVGCLHGSFSFLISVFLCLLSKIAEDHGRKPVGIYSRL